MLHPIKFEIGNLEYFITFLSPDLPDQEQVLPLIKLGGPSQSTESCGTKDRRKQRRDQDRTDM